MIIINKRLSLQLTIINTNNVPTFIGSQLFLSNPNNFQTHLFDL